MHFIHFVVSFLLFSCQIVFSQDIKGYVLKNAVRIKSISPDAANYEDLEQIGNAIKDSRVVFLGEQDHGDAATFLAKTRLIKFLHEKKGFNVLAFEGDFFSLYHEWSKSLVDNNRFDKFVLENIGQEWSKCGECFDLLFSYLPRTIRDGDPLILNGIDNITNTIKFIPALDSLITALHLPIAKTPEFEAVIFPQIKNWYNYAKDPARNNEIQNNLSLIKQQIADLLGPTHFWVQAVQSFAMMNYQFRESLANNLVQKKNIRDSAMADNLRWLTEFRYPTEKIIVWAANYHVSKYAGHYPNKYANGYKSMGTIYTAEPRLMAQSYIIGFSSFQGTAGRIGYKKYSIGGIKKHSFESWLAEKFSFAFVDFKPFEDSSWTQKMPFMLSSGTFTAMYHTSQLGEWTKVFDGIFFIRDMYSCTIKE